MILEVERKIIDSHKVRAEVSTEFINVNNYLTTTQLKGIIKSIPLLNREINVCKRYTVCPTAKI